MLPADTLLFLILLPLVGTATFFFVCTVSKLLGGTGPRFTLRFLFWLTALLAAAAGVVGREWRIVRERHDVRNLVLQRAYPAKLPISPFDHMAFAKLQPDYHKHQHHSLIRAVLGDVTLPDKVMLAVETPDRDLSQMQDVFPEVIFYRATGK